jgi:threonine/homoserine/homoserine lactone efflux protein
MMLSQSQLGPFLIASFVLCVTPGPGVTYIVTRSLAEGRRAGLGSVAGVALGNSVSALVAALGLAAALAASAIAFQAVKYAGAAYLVYLGVQVLHGAERPGIEARRQRTGRVVRDGLAVATLNPKTALFFAAFVPQFVAPGPGATAQTLALSLVFVLMALATDSAYALTASSLAPVISRSGLRRAGRLMAGGVYVGLGVLAAVSGRPARV